MSLRDEPPHNLFARNVVYCDMDAPIVINRILLFQSSVLLFINLLEPLFKSLCKEKLALQESRNRNFFDEDVFDASNLIIERLNRRPNFVLVVVTVHCQQSKARNRIVSLSVWAPTTLNIQWRASQVAEFDQHFRRCLHGCLHANHKSCCMVNDKSKNGAYGGGLLPTPLCMRKEQGKLKSGLCISRFFARLFRSHVATVQMMYWCIWGSATRQARGVILAFGFLDTNL